MKEIIKKYLEGCCQADPYFKAKYVESQLDKCMEFITDMAKERANGEHCVAIEDATVFKWARDFYNEGTAALEAERERKAEEEQIFIGNCELPFIKSGLEKAIEKPTWAANVGEIRALNELSMTLKSK